MNKVEFITELSLRLSGKISKSELNELLDFYEQSIDERIDNGMSETDAVQSLSSIDQIVSDILIDIPLAKVVGEKVKSSKEHSGNKKLWMILAIAGFPIWFPVGISLAAVAFALYITIWALVISIYAVWVALAVSLVAGIITAVDFFSVGQTLPGIAFILAGLSGTCIAIALFKPTMRLAKQTAVLTVKLIRKIKKIFKVKEGEKA